MMQKATFGAGCFWQVEATFRKIKGVVSTTVGYTGGNFDNPTYKDICSDETGHAEVVEVAFDTKVVSYKELLDVFWKIHDPTTLNRQGLDIGTQYRSIIFYHNNQQKKEAIESLNTEQKNKDTQKLKIRENQRFSVHRKSEGFSSVSGTNYIGNKIVTEITSAKTFYKAEEYHQQYLEKRGSFSIKNWIKKIYKSE